MLTNLQLRIARIALQASPADDLALAGGAAVIYTGLVDRRTEDLDLFTTTARVREVAEALTAALEQEGLLVQPAQVTPSFARVIVTDGVEECRVDIAQDVRSMPAQETAIGPVLAAEELAADKTLTLFARAEARDYVDVFFLARRFGRARLLELAREKDPGFDEKVFGEMLDAIGRLDREEFDIDDGALAELREFFATWRTALGTGGNQPEPKDDM